MWSVYSWVTGASWPIVSAHVYKFGTVVGSNDRVSDPVVGALDRSFIVMPPLELGAVMHAWDVSDCGVWAPKAYS